MKFTDLVILVLKSIKSRLSRTVYTTLGVAIGIGAILFLVSLGYGLQQTLLERITTAESLLTLDVSSPESEIISLNQATVNKITEIPEVEKVSTQTVFPGRVSLRGLTSVAVINLVDPDYFVLSGIRPKIGRIFNQNEGDRIMVNSMVGELFNLEKEEMLGKEVRLSISLPQEETEKDKEEGPQVYEPQKDFKIVGVVEEEETSAVNIYLQEGGLPGFLVDEYQFAKVKVKENKGLEETRDRLIGMGFMVSSLSDTVAQTNRIFFAIQIILGVFGVAGLIVAAVGLVNTMSITLLERISEIGIMRAIGASSRDIRRLFLMESTISGFLGGIVGVILGVLAGELFNFVLNLLAKSLGGEAVKIFYYPFWFILSIILLSVFVGFVAGFLPARRAASLNPLEALRYK